MRWLRTVAAAALVLAGTAANAHAGAVMQINDGTAYLFSGEVHPISSLSLSVLENGNGQPALVNPLLLVVGVPNSTAFAAPTMTLSLGSADLGGDGSGAFGSSYSGSTGLATSNGGLFNTGEVYSFLGLTSGNNSNSFGNWAGADLAVNGLSVSGFGIFVYELTGTSISGGESITATFNGAIPVGTFVVAYGQSVDGTPFTTPFTESGLTNGGVTPQATPTPEPATLILLGGGLSALYAKRRKTGKLL